jgi:hypothetical protein
VPWLSLEAGVAVFRVLGCLGLNWGKIDDINEAGGKSYVQRHLQPLSRLQHTLLEEYHGKYSTQPLYLWPTSLRLVACGWEHRGKPYSLTGDHIEGKGAVVGELRHFGGGSPYRSCDVCECTRDLNLGAGLCI